MKTLKKRLLVTLMSMVFFLTGIFAVGGIQSQKAGAADQRYGNPDLIYYFTDYYSTVPYYDLENDYCEVIVDRKTITEQDFNDMFYNGYFRMPSSPDIRVYIIDIKTFVPDPEVLYDLFYVLQEEWHFTTAFITITDEYERQCASFLEYVNVFVVDTEFVRLKNFVGNALRDFYYGIDVVNPPATFLIDGDLVDMNIFSGEDVYVEFMGSIFLDVMYEIIESQRFNIDFDRNKLLIHLNNNTFIDFFSGEFYDNEYIEEIMREEPGTDYVCAFGFWRFAQGFYDYLWNVQRVQWIKCPVYALLVDHIVYGPDGLEIIDDEYLNNVYGFEEDPAARALLDGLGR